MKKSGKHIYALDQMPDLQSKMKLKLPQLVFKSADAAFPWEQTDLLSLHWASEAERWAQVRKWAGLDQSMMLCARWKKAFK